ncbi:MAG: hypothetical protein MRY21_04365 [Simkaniaceae bacterium]|nr:hypothetical protein [Simkaniaceae bacterium]
MEDAFIIYLDRLSDEKEESIDFKTAPQFVNERELTFGQVDVNGKAYMAGDHLIIDLNVKASASMPCKICNEMSPFEITLNHLLITVEPKGAVYDFSEDVREALLLELPQVTECQGGECPDRVGVEKYFAKSSSSEEHFPFSALDEGDN